MSSLLTLGIVICNFNKAAYLKNAIASILKSQLHDISYKIIIVDNHSTDGSKEYLEKLSENNDIIIPIFLPENVGGSGGFHAGMNYALGCGFDYIMLCDNDIVLEESCIKNLIEFLKSHTDFGAVGSLICFMDEPDVVQELGARIDMEQFDIDWLYNKQKAENLPDYIECDYVAACSVMVRGEVLKKCGAIQKDYFIYWDDIDWCYRIKMAGYKIGAYSKSVTWHKGNTACRETTFGTYYFWRNRIRFFLTHLDTLQVDIFIEHVLEEAFRIIFMLNLRKRPCYITSMLIAIEDGFSCVSGKADDRKILKLEPIPDRALEIIMKYNSVCVANKEKYPRAYKNLSNKLDKASIPLIEESKAEFSGLTIELCDHVLNLQQYKDGVLYVDEFLHVVSSIEELELLKSYTVIYDYLKSIILPKLKLQAMIFRQSIGLQTAQGDCK